MPFLIQCVPFNFMICLLVIWIKSLCLFNIILDVVGVMQLESNISPLALSAEWSKHVDSDVSLGSASHIITSSARGSSKNMIGRRRPKGLDSEPGPTLNTSSGLGIFWWRGGRLSRKVFNWKVLPRSLVSKAARQGPSYHFVFIYSFGGFYYVQMN